MKRKYTLRRLIRILIIAIILLSLFLFFAPGYVSRALIYQKVNIDDYKIFENHRVKAENPVPWNKASKPESLHHRFKRRLDSMESVAYLVIRHDTIICEQYWEDYGKSSISNAFSATKSIVSLLTGIALEKGYIQSLDQPVGDFIDHFSKGKNKKLTIRHLLTMSSGLNWDESYGSLFSTTTQAYYGKDLNSLVSELDVVEKPGKQYKYLSGNTQLLGLLITRATNMSLSEFASKNLWTPIGARHDALWSLDKEGGLEKAYCCFNSNARDFARIGQLVLDSGRFQGKTIVPEEYMMEAVTPASYLKDENGNRNDFYGYQWWILEHQGRQVKYARGILGQYIFAIPEEDAVVVRLGHKRSTEYTGHHTNDVFLYLDAAFSILN